MRASASVVCCTLILLLAGCRDAADVFVPADRGALEAVGGIVRVTWSTHDDRSPSWNAAGDSIYYSGSSPELAPGAPATILAASADGAGVSVRALHNITGAMDATRWLLAPAAAPDGERIAFLDLAALRQHNPCNEPAVLFCPLRYDSGSSIRLGQARLRVRAFDALHSLAEDPALPIEYGDIRRDTVLIDGLPTFETRFHPFQAEFLHTGELPTRVSWAPDGERIALSDGLRILVWDAGTGALDTVPGTLDGAAPAWSPDGARIAYARTARMDSVVETCGLGEIIEAPPNVIEIPHCFERRTVYVTDTSRIVLVRPDGSDEQVVAVGRDPAWAPDGTLWFAAADSVGPLRSMDPTSGEITLLEGSEGGREPAPSPDGSRIAFSRGALPGAPRDIFVMELP